MTACPQCYDVGWVLDARLDREPLTVELIECPIPDCPASGRRIEHLSFKPPTFTRAVERHGFVIAVGR